MRAIILIVVLLFGFAFPATADDIADAQAIIRSQAEALSRDDGDTAYSFAAPAIKGMFRDADSFMTMVRTGYAPVYRHKRFSFGSSKIVDGVVIQEVDIVDAEGNAWTARYTVERQTDGSLKITGCALMKATTA
jgi:parvulin-like peptidyl-prolyl isomerase